MKSPLSLNNSPSHVNISVIPPPTSQLPPPSSQYLHSSKEGGERNNHQHSQEGVGGGTLYLTQTSQGLYVNGKQLGSPNSKASSVSAKTSCSEISNISSRASSHQELILKAHSPSKGFQKDEPVCNNLRSASCHNGLVTHSCNNTSYKRNDDFSSNRGYQRHSTTNLDYYEEESHVSPPGTVSAETKSRPWKTLTYKEKLIRIRSALFSVLCVLILLYIFVCSLDLMGSALKLMAGKTAGNVFTQDSLLSNPVAGLMVGVMATVLVQSSSTSTSIVVTMVASKILEVPTSIPIIMGANIGTSVTNTIVSMGQIQNRDEFRRAFAGATVHDMFNWLTVLVLLPFEIMTSYLQFTSRKLVQLLNVDEKTEAEITGLDLLTDPVMKRIVIVDKSVITNVETTNGSSTKDGPVLKRWCGIGHGHLETKSIDNVSSDLTGVAVTSFNDSMPAAEGGVEQNLSLTVAVTQGPSLPQKCEAVFNMIGWSDLTTGLVLFAISLFFLCLCLILLVKVLKGIFSGQMSELIKKTVNDDFPGFLSYFTGFFAIFVGTIMTILVQSSSVFTSTLTPLVGLDVIKVERVFPLTLGSNIGTTVTGLLAAMAADAETRDVALQIAFCHLLFNVTGILIWYPVPILRRVPIRLAKVLGDTTADFRWFALFYLICMFILAPLFVFLLSLAGPKVTIATLSTIIGCVLCILLINCVQKSPRYFHYLPDFMKNWEWLPRPLHSLSPWDDCFRGVWSLIRKLLCKFSRTNNNDNPSSGHNTTAATTIATSTAINNYNNHNNNDQSTSV